MLFHKYLVMFLPIFFWSVSAKAGSLEACRELTELIQRTTLKGVSYEGVDDTPVFDGMLLVSSYQENISDKCLIRIASYNLGTSWSEYWSDLIEKRGEKILPILQAEIRLKPGCDIAKNVCSDRYRQKLEAEVSRIIAQKGNVPKTDSTGFPIKYIPEKDRPSKLQAFKKSSSEMKPKMEPSRVPK